MSNYFLFCKAICLLFCIYLFEGVYIHSNAIETLPSQNSSAGIINTGVSSISATSKTIYSSTLNIQQPATTKPSKIVKLISMEIKKDKNEFPLRRLLPFVVDATLEVKDLSEQQKTSLCEKITSSSEGFIVKECKPVGYANNYLNIEMKVEGKYTGENTLKIVLKVNDEFSITGNDKQDCSGFYKERICDCSQYFESRDDPAKEFDEGVDFAKCVNSWNITNELENDTTQLVDLERNVPQNNFAAFSSFVRSAEKPKSLFNWFLGVLSVKPQDGFRKYLSVFQHGCMNYLYALFKKQNPLYSYYDGLNSNIISLSRDILNNPSTMLVDTGLEKISETNLLIEKKKFIAVQCEKKNIFYKGEGSYALQEEPTKSCQLEPVNSNLIWLYDSSKLTKKPVSINYRVEQTDWFSYFQKLITFGISFSVVCVAVADYFPGDSICYFTMWETPDYSCNDYRKGCDYWKLFQQTQSTEPGVRKIANFIYENIMQDYDKRSELHTKNSGDIDLLGIMANERGGQLCLKHLGNTSMQNGAININLPDFEIQNLSTGGFLIYAYDRTNRQFGVLTDLNHPICENGYVKATGLFKPLD
jgi:hypothetical protein